MTTRHKLMNTEEGFQAIIDSLDDLNAGNLDEFSSYDDSDFGRTVFTATRTIYVSSIRCGPVDNHAVSESGDDASRYKNDYDNLGYYPDGDASRRSRFSRSPILFLCLIVRSNPVSSVQ